MIMKCEFCNKQIYSRFNKPFSIKKHTVYVSPFFRCRTCNVVFWKDTCNSVIVDVTLHNNSKYYLRLNRYHNRTELWMVNSSHYSYSIKNMLKSIRNSDFIAIFPYIINVSPVTLNQKIKTILTFL